MNDQKGYVILLHGIMRAKCHMKGLDNFLRQNGYETININYSSSKYDLSTLADMIWQDLLLI